MQAFPEISQLLKSNSVIKEYNFKIILKYKHLIQLGFQGECFPNQFIDGFYGDDVSLSHRIKQKHKNNLFVGNAISLDCVQPLNFFIE